MKEGPFGYARAVLLLEMAAVELESADDLEKCMLVEGDGVEVDVAREGEILILSFHGSQRKEEAGEM